MELAFQGKPRDGFVSEAVPRAYSGPRCVSRDPRPGLAFPPRSPLPGRLSLPPADCRGSGGDSVRGTPGGQGRGVVLGWLQSVRACAWLERARLQPSSQEPPASTQRVQTDDCHWLRFEARGILLTEKSDTPGGWGEKGAERKEREAKAQRKGGKRGEKDRRKRTYDGNTRSQRRQGGWEELRETGNPDRGPAPRRSSGDLRLVLKVGAPANKETLSVTIIQFYLKILRQTVRRKSSAPSNNNDSQCLLNIQSSPHWKAFISQMRHGGWKLRELGWESRQSGNRVCAPVHHTLLPQVRKAAEVSKQPRSRSRRALKCSTAQNEHLITIR